MGKLHYIDSNGVEQIVINESDFDATTFLYATADNTPQAKTPAEVMVILSGNAGASFSMNSQKITNVLDGTSAQDAATCIQALSYAIIAAN